MLGKLIIASLVLVSSVSSASAAEAAPPRPEARELRQDTRIGRGVASGQLTAAETARLAAQQARIDRLERRVRTDDGHVGPVERARIEAAQDRASRDIYALKHNRRAR